MKTNLDRVVESHDLTLVDLFWKAFYNDKNGDYCQKCPLWSTCNSFSMACGGGTLASQVNKWLKEETETLEEKIARLERENKRLRQQIEADHQWDGYSYS